MNRTIAMKTLYLASAIGTLILLGCSSADVGEESSQQGGKTGSAGARPLLSGLAGSAAAVSSGGTSGLAGAAAGGTPAGGTAGKAGAGGTSAAGGALVGPAGASNGEEVIGFGFGGLPGFGGASTVIRIDPTSGGGASSFRPVQNANQGGAGFELPPGLGGFGGNTLSISF